MIIPFWWWPKSSSLKLKGRNGMLLEFENESPLRNCWNIAATHPTAVVRRKIMKLEAAVLGVSVATVYFSPCLPLRQAEKEGARHFQLWFSGNKSTASIIPVSMYKTQSAHIICMQNLRVKAPLLVESRCSHVAPTPLSSNIKTVSIPKQKAAGDRSDIICFCTKNEPSASWEEDVMKMNCSASRKNIKLRVTTAMRKINIFTGMIRYWIYLGNRGEKYCRRACNRCSASRGHKAG